MNPWVIWAVMAGVVVILELFTGTFYLLMIAGVVVAAVGLSISAQLLVAAIVGSLATIWLHRSKYGWKANANAARDPNVNMDIGQTIEVGEWHAHGSGRPSARVAYRGAMWDVELHHGAGEPGRFVILEVQGSKFIVRPATI